MVPDSFWPVFWDAAKAAGFFGTVVMAIMWYLTRQDLKEEMKKDDARHAATLDVLNSIKTFMEVIKDRLPRS